MDKALLERIGKTLHALNEMTDLINEYLLDLRRQTEAEIAELQHRVAAQRVQDQIAPRPDWLKQVAPMGMVNDGEPTYPLPIDTTDPRRPYLAGRQPRRDGDTYGSVTPLGPAQGGPSGKKSEDIRKR